jgi:hypothetical protein
VPGPGWGHFDDPDLIILCPGGPQENGRLADQIRSAFAESSWTMILRHNNVATDQVRAQQRLPSRISPIMGQ